MQQTHTIRTRIAKLRQDQEADDIELCHLDQLCLASGYSDYLDEIVDRIGSSRSYYDGGTNDKEYARALSYAGFQTSYRF